jgi:hypothetical protein
MNRNRRRRRPFQLNQLGYSLNGSETGGADITKSKIDTTEVQGRIISTMSNESLLRGRQAPNLSNGFVPRVNSGLLDPIGRLGLSTQGQRRRQIVTVTPSANVDELSVHSRAIAEFVSANEQGLIVLNHGLKIEEAALSLANAFANAKILFLAHKHMLIERVANYFRKNRRPILQMLLPGLPPDFELANECTDELLPENRIAICTLSQAANLHPYYELLVVLDMKILKARGLAAILQRTEGPIQRLTGILAYDDRDFRLNQPELIAGFSLNRLYLSKDDRVRKLAKYCRIRFSHSHPNLPTRNKRRAHIESILENSQRNEYIANCVARNASTSISLEGDSVMPISRLGISAPTPRCVVILVEEIYHAAQLLQYLADWRLITRLTQHEICQSPFSDVHRTLLLTAKANADERTVICVADSLRQAKRLPCDVLIHASAKTEVVSLPESWLYSNDPTREFLICDIEDHGHPKLEGDSDKRAKWLQRSGISKLGTSDSDTLLAEVLRTKSIRI